MLCPGCKKDVSVIVAAQVVVALPVIVHANRDTVKINERGKVSAKVPETGICSECGAEMLNPIRDLNEWKKLLTPGGLNENTEERLPEIP